MDNITLDTSMIDILGIDNVNIKHTFSIRKNDGESGGAKDGTKLTQHGTFDFSKITLDGVITRAISDMRVTWQNSGKRDDETLVNNGKVVVVMKAKHAKMSTAERELHNAKKLSNDDLLARIELLKSLAKERS